MSKYSRYFLIALSTLYCLGCEESSCDIEQLIWPGSVAVPEGHQATEEAIEAYLNNALCSEIEFTDCAAPNDPGNSNSPSSEVIGNNCNGSFPCVIYEGIVGPAGSGPDPFTDLTLTVADIEQILLNAEQFISSDAYCICQANYGKPHRFEVTSWSQSALPGASRKIGISQITYRCCGPCQ